MRLFVNDIFERIAVSRLVSLTDTSAPPSHRERSRPPASAAAESWPNTPCSEGTSPHQDKVEYGRAGQVFNGFGLSREALTVLLNLLRSATIQTLVFLFCLLAVHHTDGLQSV
ncbi:hypothetical protein cypCar_00041259 [Cyprinus carpio]|nr:hypothetical protein cypCar_00041259 [Cyprinus carpio]